MSILIKGLNIKPCEDGFDGKGLVIIGYDDKTYLVAHEQIIPLPDHGDLLDKDELSRLVGESFEYFLARLSLKCPKAVIPAERSEDGKYKI